MTNYSHIVKGVSCSWQKVGKLLNSRKGDTIINQSQGKTIFKKQMRWNITAQCYEVRCIAIQGFLVLLFIVHVQEKALVHSHLLHNRGYLKQKMNHYPPHCSDHG